MTSLTVQDIAYLFAKDQVPDRVKETGLATKLSIHFPAIIFVILPPGTNHF